MVGQFVYNEECYIERERELIKQSNLDLELVGLEERHIQEMRDESPTATCSHRDWREGV